jgi:uncharacterized membrane protein required for colicin V production
MDIVQTVGSLPLVDLAIFLGMFACFVLGVMQGSIRRLLGIIAILFAFLLAANLREPFGKFLADNWRQFPPEYNRLLAFLLAFVIGSVLLSIVIQGFYKRTELYARRPIVDDIVGGVLGLVQGLLLLVIVVVILDSYKLPDARPGDVAILRQVSGMVHDSNICNGIREVLVPPFVHVLGLILPPDLVSLFP